MRSVRSPFLKAIRKAFFIARAGSQQNSAPTDELIDRYTELKSGIDRRKFIGDVAKTGMFLGMSGLLSSCAKDDFLLPDKDNPLGLKKKPGTIQPRVAIIGGGMAGLNCAYQLQKKGIFSTIYEGSDHTGGRIQTKQNFVSQGIYSEIGGEFIDTGHKHMKGLAAEFGLPLLDTESGSESSYLNDTFYIDGQHYTDAQVMQAFAPYANIIASDVSSLPTSFGFNNYTSVVQMFDNMSISAYFDSIGLPLTGFLRKGLEVAYNTEYGREVNEQTAINFLFLFHINPGNNKYEIFGASDERYKVSGGNQRIPDALVSALPGQILLNHKLLKITRDNSNVYQLYFDNSTTVSADIVVVTIPFTMLRNVDLSNLSLPDWKTNAIQNLGYGTNAKLLLGFNQRSWRNHQHTGGVFTTGALQNPTEYIQTGWDSSRMQSGPKGSYTVFQGGNLGVALNQGQAGTFVNQLESMWPGSASAYNGTSKLIHWPSFPFTMGSYACWKVGQVTTIMGAEFLPVDKLHFAGEHTSQYFQGYMEGAAETGSIVAKNISMIV